MKSAFGFLIILISGLVAQAQSKSSLSVLGLNDWKAFILTAKEVKTALGHGGYSNKILVFNEQNPQDPDLTPGIPLEVIKDNTIALLKDQSEQNILYLLGHAWFDRANKEDGLGAEQVGMYLNKTSRLYGTTLARLVSENKRPGKKLKIWSNVCYGNAFHEASFRNPNTCSLGYGNREIYYLTDRLNPLDVRMFQNISDLRSDFNKDGKASLLEAFQILAGSNSWINEVGPIGPESVGQLTTMNLSSFAYAQKMLGQQTSKDDFHFQEETQGPNGAIRMIEKVSFACSDISDEDFRQTPGPSYALIRMAQAKGHCLSGESAHSANSLAKLPRILESLAQQNQRYQISEADLELLPNEFQSAFQQLSQPTHLSVVDPKSAVQSLMARNRALAGQWSQIISEYLACLETSGCYRIELQGKILSTKTAIIENLKLIESKSYFYRKPFPILPKFQVLATALKKGNLQDKKKLRELMACETDAL